MPPVRASAMHVTDRDSLPVPRSIGQGVPTGARRITGVRRRSRAARHDRSVRPHDSPRPTVGG